MPTSTESAAPTSKAPAPSEDLDDETGVDDPDYYPVPAWLRSYVEAEQKAPSPGPVSDPK